MNVEHLKTILWLRWRLTRNQMMRNSGGLGLFLAASLAVLAVLLLLVSGVAGIGIGWLVFRKPNSMLILGFWDALTFGFFVMVLASILSEIQRAESIDLTRFLHLPVSLKQVFFLNYLASNLSLFIIIFLPFMVGVSVGATLRCGPMQLLQAAVVLAFVFMVTAWVYCFRGWLSALMSNPRKRRGVVVWVTIAIVGIAQLPNLANILWQRQFQKSQEQAEIYFTNQSSRAITRSSRRDTPLPVPAPASASNGVAAASQRADRPIVPNPPLFQKDAARFRKILLEVHHWTPPLWMAGSARGLADGNPLPALLFTAGMMGLGWMGLRRAYRSTLRFYLDGGGARDVAPQTAAADVASGRRVSNWVEGSIPFLPQDVAGLALAQLRSMSRAAEIRLMMGMNCLMTLVLLGLLFGGTRIKVEDPYKPLIVVAMIALVFFGMLQVVFNQFGHDRDGFRALVLLPTRREHIVLGKNMALAAIALLFGVVFIGGLTVFLRPSPAVLLAACIQFCTGYILLCIPGNLLSILMPFRVAPGSLKPNKVPFFHGMAMLVAPMLMPFAMIPLAIPPLLGVAVERLEWMPASVVNLGGSVVVLALTAGIYRLSLPSFGRLLQQRETRILQAVSETTE